MKQVTATAAESIQGVITAGNLYDGVWVTVHQTTLENPTSETEDCLVIVGEDGGYHCVGAEFIGEIADRVQ